MEVYQFANKEIAIRLLEKYRDTDRELYNALAQDIIIPGETTPDLIVLSGSAGQAFIDELQKREEG